MIPDSNDSQTILEIQANLSESRGATTERCYLRLLGFEGKAKASSEIMRLCSCYAQIKCRLSWIFNILSFQPKSSLEEHRSTLPAISSPEEVH